MSPPNSPRVRRLCAMLRASANSFVTETSSAGGGSGEDAEIRTGFDCLLSLWEQGLLDPVDMLRRARALPVVTALDPGTEVPLG